MTIEDQFEDMDEFECLLSQAYENAESEHEIEFVESVVESFEKYGKTMYFSDKQKNWLISIAAQGAL